MHRRQHCRAFTLIQTLMSMAVGSVAIAVAVPKVKQAELKSRATVIAADFRTFAAAFDAYAQERGGWPDETEVGVLPPEMAQRLHTTGWSRVTPIGGRYNWENGQLHNGSRPRAAVSISSTADDPVLLSEETLLEIDRLLDDGNLATGSFRTGVNYDALFIIQQ